MNITEKYKGKHCEVCGTDKNITRDHIIPKWLEKRFPFFGLDIHIVNNDQYLCDVHNTQKGGKIDYSDERVRRFLRKFVIILQEKLEDVDREIKLEKHKVIKEARKNEQDAFDRVEYEKLKKEQEERAKNKAKDDKKREATKKELNGIKF